MPFFMIRNFHHADIAWFISRLALDMAEGRNMYTGSFGNLKNGKSLFGNDLIAV